MSKQKPNKKGATDNTIALNRQARHDYAIEERLEAGLVLEGWEVKSLRAGRVQLKESYVVIKDAEAWLLGAHIPPYRPRPPISVRTRHAPANCY